MWHGRVCLCLDNEVYIFQPVCHGRDPGQLRHYGVGRRATQLRVSYTAHAHVISSALYTSLAGFYSVSQLIPQEGSEVLLSACLYVCLSVHISQKPHVRTSRNVFAHTLPVVAVWSSCSGGIAVSTSVLVDDVMFKQLVTHNNSNGVSCGCRANSAY